MAFFVQAPIGSLVHMLTASSDFDATFDVSFEVSMAKNNSLVDAKKDKYGF